MLKAPPPSMRGRSPAHARTLCVVCRPVAWVAKARDRAHSTRRSVAEDMDKHSKKRIADEITMLKSLTHPRHHAVARAHLPPPPWPACSAV